MVDTKTSYSKHKKMTLEKLANELLLELFEHLDAGALFQAFYGLNLRFNTLLLTHPRGYHIDSRSILRYQSSFLTRQHLPRIVDQTVSLCLTYHDGESTHQMDFFAICSLRLHQFSQLHSISLCYIAIEQMLRGILIACHQLPKLTHLKVIQCYHKYMSCRDFSNRIWNLPHLRHCRLDMKENFHVPTKISLSIQYVSISCASWLLSQTAALLQQTPSLQQLHTPLNYLNDNHNQRLPFQRFLTILKLSDVRSSQSMTIILQAVPNLTHLKVDAQCITVDGYQWEEIIDNYLPELKILRLRMNIQFGGKKNNEQNVMQFVDSFRTAFWLQKHQWFIRYSHRSYKEYQSVLLYTIPYGFRDYSSSSTYQSICLQDNDYSAYENVHDLSYDPFKMNSFFPIRYPNLRNLNIRLPLERSSWQNLSKLNQLKSLSVSTTDKNASRHLQALLNGAPYLHSLQIELWPTGQVPATQNASSSLRRLDFLSMKKSLGRGSVWFNREQCETLMQSSVGIQCEELLISISNRAITLDLVKKMPRLRLLCVKYPLLTTDRWHDFAQRHRDDGGLQWLQNNLPSTCTISEYRDDNSFSMIWMFLDKS